MKQNKIINFVLTCYYTLKGFFKSKKLKTMKTYFGGVNNCYGQYLGNNTFYESKTVTDQLYGVTVFDGRKRKYNYLQLGLFDWKPAYAEIETNFQ